MSKALFPFGASGSALLATFALFGVGFILRPLGGVLLGRFGDKKGRKPALLLTITLMAIGTLLVAVTPPFRAAGLLTPGWLLAARLVQGFSAGGEWGVATAYLSEWAPSGRRGFTTSFLSVTVAVGSLLASGITGLLVSTLPPGDMAAWGWRAPFGLGALLGLAGLWARSRMRETPAYQVQTDRATAPVAPGSQGLRGLMIFGVSVHWSVCYYMFLVYMPAFMRAQAHLTAAAAMASDTICLGAIVCLVPVCGWLSDRVGRRPAMMASCAIVIPFVLPAFGLLRTLHAFGPAVGVQLVFACAIALYSGAAPAMIAEAFPTAGRSRWAAVPYALAVAVFGGFAPFIADVLIRWTGTALAPAFYVMAASGVSLVVVALSRETSLCARHDISLT